MNDIKGELKDTFNTDITETVFLLIINDFVNQINNFSIINKLNREGRRAANY